MASIPDEFMCPITLDIMKDPVLCEDGYTYEKSAIMAIQNSLSPMTRQPINKTKLIPNRALKNTIDRFLSSNTQYQSILLDKKRKDKKREQELKVKHEMERKLEKEKREQEHLKINELKRLREEKFLYEKRESENKYEEDVYMEREILEQHKNKYDQRH